MLLAKEAAAALAGLASDPRALVISARRLLEAHPGCGPLWWVAARLLASLDVEAAAADAIDALDADPTGEELAAALPAGATVVCTASQRVLDALATRPDVTVRCVVGDGDPRVRFPAAADVTGWRVSEVDAALRGAGIALLDVRVGGPLRSVVGGTGVLLADRARLAVVEIWAAAGTGTLLPALLAEAACARAGASSVVSAAVLSTVVGPGGAEAAASALIRDDCPALAELAG